MCFCVYVLPVSCFEIVSYMSYCWCCPSALLLLLDVVQCQCRAIVIVIPFGAVLIDLLTNAHLPRPFSVSGFRFFIFLGFWGFGNIK